MRESKLAKRALGVINRGRSAAKREASKQAGVVNTAVAVAGSGLAAFHDHKRGTPDAPAEILGVPANLVGGTLGAVACALYPHKIPAAGIVGSAFLGIACGGGYRYALEHFEKN